MFEEILSLDRLQRWMQSVITHPGGVRAGVDSQAAREQIDIDLENVERIIRSSRAQSSVDRLSVYAGAYYARLIECLAAEFPALHEALGNEAFRGFVVGYLQEDPSRSYTLSDLGAGVPDYLARSRPLREGEQPDWADFLVDLARLERLYSEVFDGPGEEQVALISAEELMCIPPDRWGDVRLETAASLRLVELRFPVQDYVTAVRQSEAATTPAPQATRLAVNRREYVVRRRSLDQLPFEILKSLQRKVRFYEAIEHAITVSDGDTSDLERRLRKWFADWTVAGYFVGVQLPSV